MKYLVIAALALSAFGCKKDEAAADADAAVEVVDTAAGAAQDATPTTAEDATPTAAVDATQTAD